ncbi:rho GTPase-activating protein 19-like isoform X2 [Aricia agestis]|uniref:rho GTPase-activating protein 19-like isoform X2 n=1 Tax=Aricia agestis TaxID=91739 RepID=UPI001C209EF7|nr:rho GTPase-activating protein 19-like isoform X2 [Aricia agestis]
MSTSELIDKLRNENLDQFFTLVRMHLSFVVDINTDDVECSTDKPKQFRWNFHKKTKNSNANSSQNVNNMKKNEEVNSITEEGMLRLYELIEFLSLPDNVIQEGIFRRTGSLSRQQELKNLLITGSNLGLDEGRFTVHDCASVLKGFLAELPQPLLMEQYYQTYCTLASQYPPNLESSETKLLTALQLLLLLLAPSHRNFLERLLRLLRLVADNEPSNRMSPDTLATMFTPHLLCPRKLSPEAFHQESLALAPLMSFMIRQSSALWAAPAQLVTDAAAYLAVRERKKALSPAADLDESYTDRTAANTVYTFVDRSRSVAEHAANPTDTALAQLYAHIHALPPSAHRRRLIKHFNRQNGYGTPIQIQRTGKVAGSKSFGDSIKRHIFNKGLLNKTPKKGSGSSINTVAEESIMTPRSRKPLIITSEQRDNTMEASEPQEESLKVDNFQSKSDIYQSKSEVYQSKSDIYQSKSEVYQSKSDIYRSISPKNDSDFVSSDDEMNSRSYSFERSRHASPRINIECTELGRSSSSSDKNFNTTLLAEDIENTQKKSLTEPFREYLLSRSVLTATPIDLSILNQSSETEKISESLLYCLNGNVPSDLTSSISNLAVESIPEIRTPLKDVNVDLSPNRKRSAPSVEVTSKLMKDGEENFKPHETDL